MALLVDVRGGRGAQDLLLYKITEGGEEGRGWGRKRVDASAGVDKRITAT